MGDPFIPYPPDANTTPGDQIVVTPGGSEGANTQPAPSTSANWNYLYRPEMIVPEGVINERRPGKAIAEAITEIQQKAVIDVGTVSLNGITGSLRVSDNKLNVNLSVQIEEVKLPKKVVADAVTIEETETSENRTFAVKGNGEAETYQVFQKKADGSFGFDYVRFHD